MSHFAPSSLVTITTAVTATAAAAAAGGAAIRNAVCGHYWRGCSIGSSGNTGNTANTGSNGSTSRAPGQAVLPVVVVYEGVLPRRCRAVAAAVPARAGVVSGDSGGGNSSNIAAAITTAVVVVVIAVGRLTVQVAMIAARAVAV